jgi:hypothetical protein
MRGAGCGAVALLALACSSSLVVARTVDVASRSSPLVSLVMATRGGATDLMRLAIDSARQQTYPNVELVILDGGASASLDAKEAQRVDGEWLRYIHVQSHGAQAASLGDLYHTGAMLARGAVVMHWDEVHVHSESRVALQVQPLLAGAANVTVLDATSAVLVSPSGVASVDLSSLDDGCGVRDEGAGASLAFMRALVAADGAACVYPDDLVDPAEYMLACLFHSPSVLTRGADSDAIMPVFASIVCPSGSGEVRLPVVSCAVVCCRVLLCTVVYCPVVYCRVLSRTVV